MKPRRSVWIAAALVAVLSAACGQTDAGITTAVKSKLAVDDDVKAYQIDVDTNNKVVTLTGAVDTAAAKARAVEIAKATDGVASVVDNVTIGSATASTPVVPSDVERAMFSDTSLTAAVKGAFIADTAVSALKIDVDTRDGVVTLTGQVRTQIEKDQALKIARETSGVKDVVDRLTVMP